MCIHYFTALYFYRILKGVSTTKKKKSESVRAYPEEACNNSELIRADLLKGKSTALCKVQLHFANIVAPKLKHL